MIDGNQLREEFGRYLAEHKAMRWGMDAALMHVCKIAYDAGKADGPANPDPLHLSRILHELAGAASLCWEPRPTGVFDPQLAIQFVEQALAEIRSRMTSAPAGVPMPKPVAYGFGNTAITGHTNRLMMVRIDVPLDDQYAGAFWLPLVLADEAHTYGVACRAAGEAAGYARGLTAATMTQAATDVLAERQRQISAEGWTPEHDDAHICGSIAAAAACYAAPAGNEREAILPYWPWNTSWWKPKSRRSDLVKAGALILAEIERLDRAAMRGEVKP